MVLDKSLALIPCGQLARTLTVDKQSQKSGKPPLGFHRLSCLQVP